MKHLQIPAIPNLLRESLHEGFTTICAQRNLIERFLRSAEQTLQCDVVRLQLSDLLELFMSSIPSLTSKNLLDPSISFCNVAGSPDRFLIFLDFVWKLRQVAFAFGSLLVDADTHISVLCATKTILDLAIDACPIRSPFDRDFGVRDSKL